jgi:hypothetical protein
LEEVELIGVGAAADHREAGRAIDRLTFRVLCDERSVPRVLDVVGDLLDRLVPGNSPLRPSADGTLRGQQAAGLLMSSCCALGAKSSPVDRMVGSPSTCTTDGVALSFVPERE